MRITQLGQRVGRKVAWKPKSGEQPFHDIDTIGDLLQRIVRCSKTCDKHVNWQARITPLKIAEMSVIRRGMGGVRWTSTSVIISRAALSNSSSMVECSR